MTVPTMLASSPHLVKTSKTSCSRPFSATRSMRSCDSREHHLVGGHAGFALRDMIEVHLEADSAACAHLAAGRGEAGGAHVLNADDGSGLHGFEAGFEEQLLHEWIAHLDIRPLLLGAFLELLAGHGRAVDAVAPGLGSDIYDRVADAGRLGVEDLVAAHQTERKSIHQRIAGIAGLETSFRRRGSARRSSCRRRRCRARRLPGWSGSS